jgi:hypothetical protein
MTKTFLIGAVFLHSFSLIGCDFFNDEIVSFDVISEGSYSGVRTKTEIVVDSQSEWTSLWQQHTSTRFPPPALPTIDFSSSVVVGIFGGDKPDGCYRLYLREISEHDHSVIIRYEIINLRSPEIGCTQMLTQPFTMIRVQKPQGNISIIDQGSL